MKYPLLALLLTLTSLVSGKYLEATQITVKSEQTTEIALVTINLPSEVLIKKGIETLTKTAQRFVQIQNTYASNVNFQRILQNYFTELDSSITQMIAALRTFKEKSLIANSTAKQILSHTCVVEENLIDMGELTQYYGELSKRISLLEDFMSAGPTLGAGDGPTTRLTNFFLDIVRALININQLLNKKIERITKIKSGNLLPVDMDSCTKQNLFTFQVLGIFSTTEKINLDVELIYYTYDQIDVYFPINIKNIRLGFDNTQYIMKKDTNYISLNCNSEKVCQMSPLGTTCSEGLSKKDCTKINDYCPFSNNILPFQISDTKVIINNGDPQVYQTQNKKISPISGEAPYSFEASGMIQIDVFGFTWSYDFRDGKKIKVNSLVANNETETTKCMKSYVSKLEKRFHIELKDLIPGMISTIIVFATIGLIFFCIKVCCSLKKLLRRANRALNRHASVIQLERPGTPYVIAQPQDNQVLTPMLRRSLRR